ncbi:MAG: hypothetical protein AB2L13_13860 [Spirochaetota bacterium]
MARTVKSLDLPGLKVFTSGMRMSFILILSAVAVLSCARDRSGLPRGGAVKDGPGATLVHIIDMANRNRIEEISSSVAYTLVADFDENLRGRGTDDWTQGGKRTFWDRFTRGHSVREVHLRDERISGAFAFVRCRIVYRDGGAEEVQAEMKMGGAGKWILMVYPAMLRR